MGGEETICSIYYGDYKVMFTLSISIDRAQLTNNLIGFLTTEFDYTKPQAIKVIEDNYSTLESIAKKHYLSEIYGFTDDEEHIESMLENYFDKLLNTFETTED